MSALRTGPRRALSPQRIAGRHRFAELLDGFVRAASRAGRSLIPAWAHRGGIDESAVRHWCDATRHQSAIACGDLEGLLDAAELEALLERWLEDVRARRGPGGTAPAPDPRILALTCTIRVGDAAKAARTAMADGRCVAVEWREIEDRLADVERDAREAKLAARAAAARAGAT